MTNLIVQILPKPAQLGGAERVAALERTYLQSIGREVSVMGVGNAGPHSVSPMLANRPGRRSGRIARHVGDLTDPGSRMSARRAFGSAPPRIVHVHLFQGISLDVIRAVPPTTPIVWTLHDYGALCPRNTLTNRAGSPCAGHVICSLRRRIIEATLRARPITFISPSHFLLARHVEMFAWMQSRTIVIRNPVAAPRTPIGDADLTHGQDGLRVGFLGKRTFEKGYDRFLMLAGQAGVGNLVVAGTGSGASESEPIQDLGTVDPADLDARFWAAIDVLAVPSRWPENAPMVIAEAIARGVPVMASRVGGIPEMVETAQGPTGILLSDWERSSVAEALEKLQQPAFRQSMCTATEAAAGDYDPLVHGRRIAALFDELTGP